MSQASEQIARQFANANVNKVTWGTVVINVKSTGAVGDGVNDDTTAIQAAVALIPTTGGRLVIPPGTYRVTGAILLDKTIKVEMYGAVIKPSVDTDVFRTTGLFVEIEGGKIDGSALISGSGCGVIVGYGGANAMHNRIKNVHIYRVKGHGVKWEQGAFLYLDNPIVQEVGGDAFLFTENYDDNNHGIIIAHAINCTGVGYRVKNNAVTPNNSSRHHNFVYAKAFGCTGGGFSIETIENYGNFFLELNGGTQAVFTSTSKGNNINIMGVPTAYALHSNLGSGNMIAGSNAFDQATYQTLQAEKVKIRKTAYEGSINTEPIGDRTFEVFPEDTAGDVIVRHVKRGAGSYRNDFVDGTQIGSGAIIYKVLSALVSLNFPSMAAGSVAELTVAAATAFMGDSVTVTPDAGIEAGLTWCGYVSASGVVTVRLTNSSGGILDPAARNWKVLVIKSS